MLVWLEGEGGGGWREEGGSHPKLRSIFKRSIRWRSAAVVSGAAAGSDLTGVGGLVRFPQLDSPVEPDDGAERDRWQHALSSSGTCWLGATGAADKNKKMTLPVEGPVLPALRGQMKGSDWKTSGGMGWSLILLGSLRLPHVLDRNYDRPAKQKKKNKLRKEGNIFF